MEFSVITVILILLLLGLPLTFPPFAYSFLTLALMFAAMAVSWNILGGYAGYLSFGHTSFFGVGAYTTAILITVYHYSPFLTVPLGAILAAAVMLVALYVFIRLEQAYFAIATLALNFTLYYLALALPQTNGSAGIFLHMVSGSAINFDKVYYGIFGSVVIGIVVISHLIQKSKVGKELMAMRDDRVAAESLGVDTTRAKLIAGLISAGGMGLVGAIYPLYLFYVDPSTAFNIDWSILLVVMVIFGGTGTLVGPIIGAFVFEGITELFTFYSPVPTLSTVFVGGVLVIMVLFLPSGIYGTAKKRGIRGRKVGSP
jgi:branched-chain amino acid transport system permease protein